MAAEEEKELEKMVDELNQQRIDLENDINNLNLLKIEKLESINEELENKIEWMDKERIKATKERDNLMRKVRHSKEKSWNSSSATPKVSPPRQPTLPPSSSIRTRSWPLLGPR